MPQIIIPLEDFDESLLPKGSPAFGSDEFQIAVNSYFGQELFRLGKKARVIVGPEFIQIEWDDETAIVDVCVDLLQSGNYRDAVFLLRGLRKELSDSRPVLFNLGMALSDLGELDEAVDCLEHLTQLENDGANAFVALGVAYSRKGNLEKAVIALRRACELEPANSFANRNLGGMLLKTGQAEEGLGYLKSAAEQDETDPRAWFGLGSAYQSAGDLKEAEDAYRRVIELAGSTDVGEAAKEAMRGIAQKTLRENGIAGERPDAVMYCLGALELYAKKTSSEVKAIMLELALKGGNGFDINTPSKRYEFDALEGDFSGLQAVCYMYVAGQQVLPGQDMGIDLSSEYSQAKTLFAG